MLLACSGLPQKTGGCLRFIQNAADRVWTWTKKRKHTTPNWLLLVNCIAQLYVFDMRKSCNRDLSGHPALVFLLFSRSIQNPMKLPLIFLLQAAGIAFLSTWCVHTFLFMLPFNDEYCILSLNSLCLLPCVLVATERLWTALSFFLF